MKINKVIKKPSNQSIILKHRQLLLKDWASFTYWSDTGARLYNRPVSAIIDSLCRNAIEDYKSRKKVKEVMRFRYQVADGIYCWQSYGVSNLSQVVLYPPKHRVDLKPVCTGYGSV